MDKYVFIKLSPYQALALNKMLGTFRAAIPEGGVPDGTLTEIVKEISSAHRTTRALKGLLQASREAIQDEIHAMTETEARQHPIMRRHMRTQTRLDTFLSKMK